MKQREKRKRFRRVRRQWPRRLGATERARSIAWQMRIDHGMHFHEIAMSDPFKAERLFNQLADEVLKELGIPRDVKMFTYRNNK